MSLQPCHECGREISTEARSCPNCGAPLHARYRKKAWLAIGAILIASVAAFWAYYTLGNTGTGAETGGSLISSFNENLAVRTTNSKVFDGLPIRGLRPEVLSFVQRRWGEPRCTDGADLCYVTIKGGDWPGLLALDFDDGQLREATLHLDSTTFRSVSPTAIASRLASGDALSQNTDSDGASWTWQNNTQRIVVFLRCDSPDGGSCSFWLIDMDKLRREK